MQKIRALTLVAATLLAGAASAGECGLDYCWGAVGIGPNGAWGYSHSQYSEADAIAAVQAPDACEGDCDVVQTFYNTCGALSEGSDGSWGFGYASTRELAEETSLDYCRDYGSGCRVRVWACSR